MQKYDYSKLLGKMKENKMTQEVLALKIGICATSLNLTLNNNRDFKQDEIVKICKVLGIQLAEMTEYFFAH